MTSLKSGIMLRNRIPTVTVKVGRERIISSSTFFLDKKVAKNQVSKDASLRTRPLPGSAGETWGPVMLPPYRTMPALQATLHNAPAAAQSHIVSPSLTRSFFADGLRIKPRFFSIRKIKKERGAVKARGREYGLCDGSDRLDLIFWLLLDQAKT